MDVSNSRIDKAEQRISESKNGLEEITPNTVQKNKERENMKEKLRGIEGKVRVQTSPPRGCKMRKVERMGKWQYSIFHN